MKHLNILRIAILVYVILFSVSPWMSAENEKDWMPDSNLRRVISEKLDVETLTIADMQRLYELIFSGQGIRRLKGLEFATNLKTLLITDEDISDLTPLLRLRNLHTLILFRNQIVDISPISHLIQLEHLELNNNQITDFSPLLTLTNLGYLDIRDNPDSGAGQFVSAHPRIIEALQHWMCKYERLPHVRPVKERIDDRDYPSIGGDNTGIFKKATGLDPTRLDFFGETYPFGISEHGGLWFDKSPFGGFVRSGGGPWHIQDIKQIHADFLHENANMIFLAEIRYFDGYGFGFTENSPYWLRKPDGTIVRDKWFVDAQSNEYWETLVDFTNPDVIEMIIAQAVAIANCGFYDGMILDNWSETFSGLSELVPLEVERDARVKILQGIRQAVPDDFLIVVNTTWRKIPRSAQYVNGALMETWGSAGHTTQEWGGERYTRQDYLNYEEALLWNEANLREPNFTLLAGKLPSYADRQSLQSQKTVRALTTLSLTHSDGYVNIHQSLYSSLYYDFWDAPLGRPVGGNESKGVPYRTPKGEFIDGIFIREFTNGWAVYNRSGKERLIQLPEKVTGWHSGIAEKRWHNIPDLDGEIYLKASLAKENHTPEDVNGDGLVNILDLVATANALGSESPDVNGDGVVNILDLVQISKALE